ncbi:MAG TPA: 2-oxo acid dehydrogenase subunit E2 [Myxococcales bacterium]|nr:2-oxo acid dehydrogenase subunit E2 [Myxococcales bacterium]
MPNLDLVKKKDVSSFRKAALGTWRSVGDPSVYGTLEIRMDKAVEYIAAYRQATGKRLTVTHILAKAAAAALSRMPDANSIIRFNRIYLRKVIAIFMQVVMTDEGEGKADLSGATIYDVDKKSLGEIVDEVEERVAKVRARKDESLEKARSSLRLIPFLLMRAFLTLMGFLLYTLNLDLHALGMPKDGFGSLMITNIGSLGLDQAYVPLVPYSRVPILLAMGAVKDAPVVENGEIRVGKVMKVNATFDHRIIDGFHAAIMAKTLHEYLEHPFEKLDEIPKQREPAAAG